MTLTENKRHDWLILQTKKKHDAPTMAKKHRGFGG